MYSFRSDKILAHLKNTAPMVSTLGSIFGDAPYDNLCVQECFLQMGILYPQSDSVLEVGRPNYFPNLALSTMTQFV